MRPPKNRKVYKNGARTDAPKPSRTDTRVGGDFFSSFRWVGLKPQEKSCFQNNRPRQKHPIHENSRSRRGGRPRYPSIFQARCRALKPRFLLRFQRVKTNHPWAAKNGVQLRTHGRLYIYTQIYCIYTRCSDRIGACTPGIGTWGSFLTQNNGKNACFCSVLDHVGPFPGRPPQQSQ